MITRTLIAALGIMTLVAGVQTFRLQSAKQEMADRQVESLAAIANAAEQARAEENRRVIAAQEIADEARKREEQARADAAAAAAAGDRLRQALAASRRAACSDPSATGSGQAAGATERLLSDVQRRLDESAERVAEFADQAHGAGLACQQAYESLSR